MPSDHTFEISLHYHRCPFCSTIIESRDPYIYCLGRYQKQLTCESCRKRFQITKNKTMRPAPLTGKPEPKEIDWS